MGKGLMRMRSHRGRVPHRDRRIMSSGRVAVLFALVLTVSTQLSHAATVEWYRTAQGTTDRITAQPSVSFGDDFASNIAVTINRLAYSYWAHFNMLFRSMTYQTVLGFGGAFTDSASFVFSKLNSTLQTQVLDMYFSESGLRYNMARLPIGSCDFSLENYNYDNVSGDVNLTHFSIDHDRERIIPLIKRALAVRQQWTNDSLNILGSPWSPPGWMKANSNPYCPQGCSNCYLNDASKVSWALYFSKFVTAYEAEGIKIWGITVQNEPEYCPPTYEGMNWSPETERDYIKTYLGPQLKRDHPDLNILIYDHNKDHVVEWAQTVYSDNEAAQYVWGTAVHWYTGDDFPNLNTTHYLFPDKPILASEATEVRESDPKNPDWGKGEHYAHDIMGDMNNWVVGFIDWNLILDMLGGPNHKGPDECEGSDLCGSDSMMLADAANQLVYPQVFYYYVGQIR